MANFPSYHLPLGKVPMSPSYRPTRLIAWNRPLMRLSWAPRGPHLRGDADWGRRSSGFQIGDVTIVNERRSATPNWVAKLRAASGLLGVGGFEEGEFERDGPAEEVAAQVRLCGADSVQLRAQEIDEAAKIRIVVQRDPLGVHEIVR
jgi:hypothetical protein